MKLTLKQSLTTLACVALLSGCTATANNKGTTAEHTTLENNSAETPASVINKDPYPSTYTPLPGKPTIITNVTVLDGIGGKIENGMVFFADGVIQAVGESLDIPPDALVIDGAGKWLTPGIIDNHSHLGVYPAPSTQSHSDGNEMTNPVTAKVWAEHSVWPQDPGFAKALAGGVTALQVLPGSANLFGGR